MALAWCFEDEHTPALLGLLERVTAAGAFAPMLWPLEVLNGLSVAERRGRLEVGRRDELAGFLRALPVMLDVETAGRCWDAIGRLATSHRLSVYDAAYLELAQRRRLRLASSDRALCAAAVSVGVELLGAPD